MEKFSLEPVFNVLQENVNTTLSEFAKNLIQNNDYSSLAKIAEIGEKTNSFFYNLSDTIHGYTAQSLNDEEEIIDAEEVKVVSPKASNPKHKFSIQTSETSEWVYNYLGRRGGTALINDVVNEFKKEFSHRFTAEDKIGERSRQHVFYVVSVMRASSKKVINLVEPLYGKRSQYYSLSAHGLKTYNDTVRKLEEKKYQQLSLKEYSG